VRTADEIKKKLNDSMSTFEHVVNNLKEEDLNVKIQERDQGWTVIEILRHVQNSENGMVRNIQGILAGGEGVPKDFDLTRYNKRANEKMEGITFDQIKENMRMYRQNTLALLDTVKDEDWQREGRHPTLDVYTVKKIFEIIAGHPIAHLKSIREKFNL
jgi:hypothetical protein